MKKFCSFYFIVTLTISISISAYAQWDEAANNYTTGKLGVGIESPLFQLHLVSSDFSIAKLKRSGTGGGVAVQMENATGLGNWHFGVGSNDHFGIWQDGMALGENLIILKNGRVGVGTLVPSSNFHIRSSIPDTPGTLIIQGHQSSNLFNSSEIVLSTEYSTANVQSGDQAGRKAIIRATATTSWGKNLRLGFYTSSGESNFPLERMVVSPAGNVGIGTVQPAGLLHLTGGNSNGSIPPLVVGGGVSANAVNDLYILDSKNLNTGVGYAARVIGVNIQNKTDELNRIVQRTEWGGVTGASAIYLGGDDVNQGQFGVLTSPQGSSSGTALTERFTVRGNGNVGIGTVSPDSKLTVKGVIHAEEVKVDLNVPGPDYVFEESYPLRQLKDTQAYINENKHLPGIPSSTEMQQNGVNLLEMNMKLLEKVEELTLYLIEQHEKNESLQMKVLRLEERMSALEN